MKAYLRNSVALSFAVALVCSPAMAQGTADKPAPKVGDKWEYQQAVKAMPVGFGLGNVCPTSDSMRS